MSANIILFADVKDILKVTRHIIHISTWLLFREIIYTSKY